MNNNDDTKAIDDATRAIERVKWDLEGLILKHQGNSYKTNLLLLSKYALIDALIKMESALND